MTNDAEWVPAMEAAKLLAPVFGGISRAEQAIAIALREGLLRARADTCASITDDEEFVIQEATSNVPIEIDLQVWRWSDNWEADVMRWSWDDGWFDIRADDAEQDRTYIGVSFYREQLERLDPSLPIFAPMQSRFEQKCAKRGPKTNTNKWGALIGALLELDRNDRLRVSDYERVAPLVNAVRTEVKTHLWLDDRTLEGVLGYVWERHLRPAGSSNERN